MWGNEDGVETHHPKKKKHCGCGNEATHTITRGDAVFSSLCGSCYKAATSSQICEVCDCRGADTEAQVAFVFEEYWGMDAPPGKKWAPKGSISEVRKFGLQPVHTKCIGVTPSSEGGPTKYAWTGETPEFQVVREEEEWK